MAQFWTVPLNAGTFSGQNSGSALANSTTLTDISPGDNTQPYTFSANQLEYTGMCLRVRATMVFSAASTPTLNLGLYWGGVVGTPLAATGNVTTYNATSNVIDLDALIRVGSIGTTGSVLTIGKVLGITSGSWSSLPASASGGNSVTINTTTAAALTLGAQWGAASNGNTITCYHWIIEQLF